MTTPQIVGLAVVPLVFYLLPLVFIWWTLLADPYSPPLGRRGLLVAALVFVPWPLTLPVLLLFPRLAEQVGKWVSGPAVRVQDQIPQLCKGGRR